MIPGKYNIVCPQGSTFQQQLTYKIDDAVVDLSGYQAKMQVREKHTSKIALVDISSAAGDIVVGSEGTIDITISSTVTEGIIAKDYLYDLELISPSNIVYRIIEGTFKVTPEVTR